MKNISIGQHFWAVCAGIGCRPGDNGRDWLVVILKTGRKEYHVCGPFECGISEEDFDFIEAIDKPDSHKETELYY